MAFKIFLQSKYLNLVAAYNSGMFVSKKSSWGKSLFIARTEEWKHFFPSHPVPRHVTSRAQAHFRRHRYIEQKRLDGLEI